MWFPTTLRRGPISIIMGVVIAIIIIMEFMFAFSDPTPTVSLPLICLAILFDLLMQVPLRGVVNQASLLDLQSFLLAIEPK